MSKPTAKKMQASPATTPPSKRSRASSSAAQMAADLGQESLAAQLDAELAATRPGMAARLGDTERAARLGNTERAARLGDTELAAQLETAARAVRNGNIGRAARQIQNATTLATAVLPAAALAALPATLPATSQAAIAAHRDGVGLLATPEMAALNELAGRFQEAEVAEEAIAHSDRPEDSLSAEVSGGGTLTRRTRTGLVLEVQSL